MSHLDRLPEEIRYAYLSPDEFRDRLSASPVLYLPIGALEWHNEHLPLGTDTLHAIELAHRLCGKLGGVVLPAFWWNTGECHSCDVTYHMPEHLYRETLMNVIRGLRPIPYRVLVLINGHGGGYQRNTPDIAARTINEENMRRCVVVADPYKLGTSSPCRIDHADTGETSFSMELIPQLVRMDRQLAPDLFTAKLPFAKGPATPEGGRQLWQAYLTDAEAVIREALG